MHCDAAQCEAQCEASSLRKAYVFKERQLMLRDIAVTRLPNYDHKFGIQTLDKKSRKRNLRSRIKKMTENDKQAEKENKRL